MAKNFQDSMIKKLFNPKHFGEIKNPDAVGESINPQCKDFTRVYLRIKNGVIKDAKFQTIGCMAAIAYSDETCELIIGKTVEEAKKIKAKDILGRIKGFPEEKSHCSVMGPKAIKDAFEKYEKKMKK